MSRILVAGSLNMDVVALTPRIPVAGETITGSRYFTAPGGKGANQAYAAARLGGNVSMLGTVGDDDFGREMRSNLAGAGCDIAGIKTVAGPSGAALICVASSGENSIIVIPGANQQFSGALLSEDETFFDGAGVLLLQLETPLETATQAAQTAKSKGITVVLDPAPAPSGPLPAELLRAVDVITPNETEACLLAGVPPSRLSAEDARRAGSRIQALGVSKVVLKVGERGCVVMQDREIEAISAPKVAALDTTGAGDIFNGALAVALSEKADLIAGCRFAILASALSVTRLGTQAAAPTKEEVEEFQRRLTD